MKLQILMTLSALSFLAACSDGPAQKSGDKVATFNISEAPQNPMSLEDFKLTMAPLNQSSKLIPDEVTILDNAIINGGAEPAGTSSEAFRSAYRKLSPMGRDMRLRIKANCILENAKTLSQEDVGRPYVGAKKSRSLISSIRGANCPMTSTHSVSQSAVYTAVTKDLNNFNTVSKVDVSEHIEQEYREALSLRSGLLTMKKQSSTKAVVENSGALGQGQLTVNSNQTVKMDYQFINDQKLHVILQIQTQTMAGKIQLLKAQYDGTGVRGNFRLVVITTATTQDFYYNGQKIEASDVSSLMTF